MNTKKIAYHLGFWLLAYLFWIFIFRNGTLVLTHSLTIQFCYLAFISANYYFNTLYNIPQNLNKKYYLGFGILFILGIIVTALLRIPVSKFVTIHLFKIIGAPFDPVTVFYNSFVNIFFWVVVIVAAKMITDRMRSQLYIEQIEKEKATNELNFLRAQFNPHFLFNSINSIYGHIDKSNKEAREMLLVLSEMLRYQLYECNVEEISLDREINYVSNYIAMQRGRIDERVKVNFCADEVDGQPNIAPLLLITFVENAFKYVGFNEDRPNLVEISLRYADDKLIFKVFNTKDSYINHTEGSSGLGIANTKRRLEILYPNRHELKINNDEKNYEVELTLEKL
ncbi:histidine kinase [Mucilaginibacter sp. dw_454]|uniref:sensor histidine kinase n=1 Tax=Mucilaginibacter sp. dw_454 TaxID=2720079 RepID=UPI001BD325BE|nr:histidine kinase [Mucilaginibacter sp. dw_454]